MQEMCRLCLKSDNLAPIFLDLSRCERYSKVLSLTTGLDVKLNDGLPQKICKNCTKSVNQAMKLRNVCHKTEKQLFKLGFKRNAFAKNNEIKKERKGGKKKNKKIEKPESNMADIDDFKIGNDPGLALPDLEIEVEFDRLTDNLKSDEFIEEKKEVIQEKETQNTVKPRKRRKEEYLSLVEGSFEPNGPVKCKICKKVLSKWATFIGHAQRHLGFKFVCEFCGKSFISSTQLARHCRSQHGLQRTLRCPRCEYLALDNAQLVLHERRVHTGDRPFSCHICSASYHSRRCLAQHLESHNTTATVQCNQCALLFKSARHLARHKYSTHTSKLYSYKCPVCDHQYKNRKYIAVHMKKAHGVSCKDVGVVKIKI